MSLLLFYQYKMKKVALAYILISLVVILMTVNNVRSQKWDKKREMTTLSLIFNTTVNKGL